MSKNNQEISTEICDRLCLNYGLYQQYLSDPESVIKPYVEDDVRRVKVSEMVQNSLDMGDLSSHWQNQIACACRDVAYQIPD